MNARAIIRMNDLTGPERAAVIMLALGEDASRPLWAALDEDELREVTLAMSSLGSVSADVVEELLAEFAGNLSATGSIMGTAAYAQRFLRKVLPSDKANLVLEDIKGPAGKTMWDKLANVNERVLAGYLKGEHPQTVAVILSRVRAEHAAKVIATLPDLFAEEVIARMLTLGPVQKDVLDQIEQTLRTEFITALSRGEDRDPYQSMAEIFNNFDRPAERRFLEALETKNPAAADRIRALMFVFEDLLLLGAQDVQKLLRVVDKGMLAVALKGARPEVADHFYRNMSERAATILKDDIEILGPLRLREVDLAQQRIVEIAKRLSDDGEIVLSKSQSEELVY